MRVQKNTILMLLSIMFVLVLITTPTDAHFGDCVHQPDGPDCPCFRGWGDWNPAGAFIQDVAIQTLGTVESCECPGNIIDCNWPFTPRENEPGKPYYQMVLGADDISLAQLASVVLTHCGPIYDAREPWCSETVAFWHLKTGIPYDGGYRRDWHLDWQKDCIEELRTWYVTEEGLPDGRGRWIEPIDVNYVEFELGVTVPVPGAYVAIMAVSAKCGCFSGGTHSLIVNEMWVHEDAAGNIFQVEVTLLEGNHRGARGAVINNRRWDDILSLTPQGRELINNNSKILGFGIDLDSTGQPVYDPARLHWVYWPFTQAPPFVTHVEPNDPVWEHYYAPKIPKLITYAQLLRTTGGPDVTCSSTGLQISGIPDGMSIQWNFPLGLTGPVEIDIDLMDVHPLPIKGIELKWDGSFLPRGYRVQFASADQQYKNALVPDFPDLSQLPTSPSIPVPAIFTLSENGVEVRYVKLIFENTFQQNAILKELRFRYYQPYKEIDLFDCDLEGDMDGNCRVDFYDVARMAANWLVDCMESPLDPACVPK